MKKLIMVLLSVSVLSLMACGPIKTASPEKLAIENRLEIARYCGLFGEDVYRDFLTGLFYFYAPDYKNSPNDIGLHVIAPGVLPKDACNG